MLDVNRRQKVFYEGEADITLESKGNRLTQIWRKMRRAQQAYRQKLGIDETVYSDHWKWMGDLAGKAVLDLGCYAGNALSLDIARKSGSYLGIDLSETAIEVLQADLAEANLPHANAEAIDFLSAEFQTAHKGQFDVIYAHSVAHHFEYFDVFLDCVRNCLSDDGRVITTDPLQTSVPVRFARTVYRPFQSDKDWEFPFTKSSFEQIQRFFVIEHVRGIMGAAKWGIPVYFLNSGLGARLGTRLRDRDATRASQLGSGLWGCMQVSMCWRKNLG